MRPVVIPFFCVLLSNIHFRVSYLANYCLNNISKYLFVQPSTTGTHSQLILKHIKGEHLTIVYFGFKNKKKPIKYEINEIVKAEEDLNIY